VALVLRRANPASLAARRDSDGGWKREPPTRRGALDEWHVISSLRQMPQTRQLARVQQTCPRERRKHAQIQRRHPDRPWYEAIARGKCERAVRRGEALEPGTDRRGGRVGWRYHGQT
jgi:hypothetical protein